MGHFSCLVIPTLIFKISLSRWALLAIIDWDGVCSEPGVLAPCGYPDWLTRDWDPMIYDYFGSGSRFENSPEELAKYRQEYLRVEGDLISKRHTSHLDELDITLTRQSLVVDNVHIAAINFVYNLPIVLKIFKEITRLVAPEVLQAME